MGGIASPPFSPVFAPLLSPPQDARHLTCGDTVIGNTATDGINCLGNDAPDVVYSFSLQEPQAVSFSTCGTHTDFDTYLRLYRNCIGDVLDSNDDSACEQVYFASSIEAVLEAGSYSIVVEGWGTETGNYELSVTCASSCSGESINEVCYSHQLQCGDTVYGATSIDGGECVGVCRVVATVASLLRLGRRRRRRRPSPAVKTPLRSDASTHPPHSPPPLPPQSPVSATPPRKRTTGSRWRRQRR